MHMETDRRFGIVIGINDYDIKPLDYSVADAKEVSLLLEKKCGFNKQDIFIITSDKEKQTKDISGHLDNAIKTISHLLKPGIDSIFFYFAGHGEYHFESSNLVFHDIQMEIKAVFDKIQELEPRYQIYVIDACQSGGKVMTRGAETQSNLIEKYIKKSAGALFMYATTENETAKENSLIKHGLFTHYFLKTVNEEKNYDEDGILTPNRIMDIVSKETSKESRFLQTPVIENRTVGYYPFAFKNPPNIQKEAELPILVETERGGDLDKEYFPNIPFEVRNELFNDLRPEFNKFSPIWINAITFEEYDVTSGKTSNIFDHDTDSKLVDSIVERSEKEKVDSINNVFTIIRNKNKKPVFSSFSMLAAFREEPEYSIYNNINWGGDNIISLTVYCKSKSVYKVSFGVAVVIYQALYGIGLSKTFFHYDYTGYTDNKALGMSTTVTAFKVRPGVTIKILKEISDFFESIEDRVSKLNLTRNQDITSFGNKAK